MYVDYCWLSFVPPFKPSWATPCNVPRNNCWHLATTPSSTPRRGMPGRLAGTDKCGEYIGDLMAISWGFKGTPKKNTKISSNFKIPTSDVASAGRRRRTPRPRAGAPWAPWLRRWRSCASRYLPGCSKIQWATWEMGIHWWNFMQ